MSLASICQPAPLRRERRLRDRLRHHQPLAARAAVHAAVGPPASEEMDGHLQRLPAPPARDLLVAPSAALPAELPALREPRAARDAPRLGPGGLGPPLLVLPPSILRPGDRLAQGGGGVADRLQLRRQR